MWCFSKWSGDWKSEYFKDVYVYVDHVDLVLHTRNLMRIFFEILDQEYIRQCSQNFSHPFVNCDRLLIAIGNPIVLAAYNGQIAGMDISSWRTAEFDWNRQMIVRKSFNNRRNQTKHGGNRKESAPRSFFDQRVCELPTPKSACPYRIDESRCGEKLAA